MEKPILFYEVRPQANRSTGGTILVPAIVEREQADGSGQSDKIKPKIGKIVLTTRRIRRRFGIIFGH